MSNVIVDKNKIDILANAISVKSGEAVTMTLDEMVSAVDGIETGGGGTPTLQTKSVTPTTSAQTITADAGYDGLEEVDVGAIPIVSPITFGNNIEYTTYYGVLFCDITPYEYYEDAGYKSVSQGYNYSQDCSFNAIAKNTSVTPTESAQTIGGENYMMEGAVTVNAIPSNYVGSGITQRSSLDLTASTLTVTAPSGYYASNASKTLSDVNLTAENIKKDVSIFGVTGSYEGGGGMSIATASTTLNSANASISFTGLQDEPTSFVITTASDLAIGASPWKTACVVYDGTSVTGSVITNTNNAQVTYNDTGFSQSYNGGTLTVTGTSTNFQANEYKLVYTYGGSSANISTSDVQVGSGATSISFTGLTDEPSYFSLIFKSNFGTSSGYQRVITVVYDGNTTYGLAMDSGAKAQTSWSYTYNAGTLTITSTGTNNGGYFHQPGYYQLTYGIGGTVELDIQPLTVTTNGTYQQSGVAYSPVTVNVSGGSSSVETKTVTNNDNTATSIQFTSLKGTPIAFFVRCATQMQSSSTTYYYVSNMRYNGTNVNGNAFRMGNTRQVTVVTSGYSYTYSGTTLTLTSSGSRTSAPGSFYNGSYELVYIY